MLTRYLIGSGEIALIAALILSESGANWPSTMMMPSLPTATVMLPPCPSSMQVLLPRSVALISILAQSIIGGGGAGGVCACAAPAIRLAASAANAILMVVLPVRSGRGLARPEP